MPNFLSMYDVNPLPTSGSDTTFGRVPGPIGLPSPAYDLSLQFPDLGKANTSISSNILNELGGNLSPSTMKLLQHQAAQFGVSSGMPGSGLSQNRYLRDLGLISEGQIQAGMKNYASIIPTISGTQTVNPNLQSEIASRNAQVAAAPNPQKAQSYAQDLFNKYLQMMRGPGGGTVGGGGGPGGGFTPGQQP